MVKFRKKTRRKLKRKSKQSIKGGRNTFRCYTEEQLDKIKRTAIDEYMEYRRVRRENMKLRREEREQKIRAEEDPPPQYAPQLVAQRSLPQGVKADDEHEDRKRKAFPNKPDGAPRHGKRPSNVTNFPKPISNVANTRKREQRLSPVKRKSKKGKGVASSTPGGSKKIKRRKKKKTRKARGIIDDLRKLCTTGRCGRPRPQRPTLRELALTIEQDIIDEFNTKTPKKTLTAKDRRNIKALANHEAARIVNTSRSASKKKKKKRRS